MFLMNTVNTCIKLPTGEMACSWRDVEYTSFIDEYYNRLLIHQQAEGNWTFIDKLLLPLKFKKLYDSIQVNKNWVQLILNNTLIWKEQKHIAEHTSLNLFELYGIMYQAEKRGYKYSEYHARVFPKDVKQEELPPLLYLDENDNPKILGESSRSLKFLKMAMLDNSNTLFAQVITKNDDWHCFFSASRGINKKESGKKSHIHYVSSKLGIPLLEVIDRILSNSYKGDKAHINNYINEMPKYLAS